MVWTGVQNYSMMFVNFFADIILARLLTPYDFGCIGMLAIFMVLAETFIEGGFGTALIQKKHPTQDDYSTIFSGIWVWQYSFMWYCSFAHLPLLNSTRYRYYLLC